MWERYEGFFKDMDLDSHAQVETISRAAMALAPKTNGKWIVANPEDEQVKLLALFSVLAEARQIVLALQVEAKYEREQLAELQKQRGILLDGFEDESRKKGIQ